MERQNYKIKPKVVNTEDPREFITNILRLSYLLYDRKDWPNASEERILVEMLLYPETYSVSHYTKLFNTNLKIKSQSVWNLRFALKQKGWMDEDGLLSKRIAPLRKLLATSSSHDLEFTVPFIIRGNNNVADREATI